MEKRDENTMERRVHTTCDTQLICFVRLFRCPEGKRERERANCILCGRFAVIRQLQLGSVWAWKFLHCELNAADFSRMLSLRLLFIHFSLGAKKWLRFAMCFVPSTGFPRCDFRKPVVWENRSSRQGPLPPWIVDDNGIALTTESIIKCT